MTTNMDRSKIIESSDTIEAIEECYRLGWSDGLPVVPPVEYKVREMLEFSGFTGEEELLSLEMRRRVLTSENAAANAVMAGCLPEYFPILTATLRALDEEKNYVNMAASSTSSPAILMIVNGPIRNQLNTWVSSRYLTGSPSPLTDQSPQDRRRCAHSRNCRPQLVDRISEARPAPPTPRGAPAW